MKKIIFAAAALFAFGFANAQDATTTSAGGKGFANGDVFVTGSAGFSSESTGDLKDNNFNITPMVGFMVSDNIAVGGMLGYSSRTQEDGINDEVKTTGFSIGAFGRYYMTPASDFSIFMQLGAAYLTAKQEIGDAEAKANGFGIEFAPGVSYFIGDNWAIEAQIGSLGYNSVKPDGDDAESTDTFNLNVNLQDVQIGVVYKF